MLPHRGLVLRSIKYSDNSLIVTVFTENEGLHSYMVRGVHSKTSKTRTNYFHPLTLIEYTATVSNKARLETIKEIIHAHCFTLEFDPVKNAIALFLAEVLAKTLKGTEPYPELFQFLEYSFTTFEQQQNHLANFHLIFLVQFSKYLGCIPHNNQNEDNIYFGIAEGQFISFRPNHAHYLEPGPSLRMQQLLNTTYETSESLLLNVTYRRELLAALVAYYQYHHLIDSPFTSISVLEQL